MIKKKDFYTNDYVDQIDFIFGDWFKKSDKIDLDKSKFYS